MKIAAFKSPNGVKHTSYFTDELGPTMVQYHFYVQASEFVDIEFPPLPVAVVVEGQIKQLDAAERELRERFQEKLNELTEARASLLSLTHESQS